MQTVAASQAENSAYVLARTCRNRAIVSGRFGRRAGRGTSVHAAVAVDIAVGPDELAIAPQLDHELARRRRLRCLHRALLRDLGGTERLAKGAIEEHATRRDLGMRRRVRIL